MRKSIIIWALMLLLSFTAATYFNGALSFLLLYFLLIIPVICLLYILIQYNRLVFRQKTDSAKLITGIPEHYCFELKNKSMFAHCYNIKLVLSDSYYDIEDLPNKSSFDLKPKQQINHDTYITCRYRGSYQIGVQSVKIPDFLNLFSLTFNRLPALNVFVLPRIIILEQVKNIPEFELEQDCSNALVKNQIDVLVRDYIDGDSLNKINWKITAKENTLKTRIYTGTKRCRMSVIIDTASIDAPEKNRLASENKIMETAIALVHYFCTKDADISVLYSHAYSSKNITFTPFEITDMLHFEHFYNEFSKISFSPSGFDFLIPEILCSEYVADSSIIIFIVNSITEHIISYANELAETDKKINIYSVTDKPHENYSAQAHNLVSITQINPEQDIKEVL